MNVHIERPIESNEVPVTEGKCNLFICQAILSILIRTQRKIGSITTSMKIIILYKITKKITY
jgi:hypothetical protein